MEKEIFLFPVHLRKKRECWKSFPWFKISLIDSLPYTNIYELVHVILAIDICLALLSLSRLHKVERVELFHIMNLQFQFCTLIRGTFKKTFQKCWLSEL